jgi:hypothetical protein
MECSSTSVKLTLPGRMRWTGKLIQSPGRRSGAVGGRLSSGDNEPSSLEHFPSSGENALPPGAMENLPGTTVYRRGRKTVVSGGRPPSRDNGSPSLEHFRRLEKTLCLQGQRRIFPGRRAVVAGEKLSSLEADRRSETIDRRHWRQTVVARRWTVVAGGFPSSEKNAPPPATMEDLPGTAIRCRWRKTVVAGDRPSSPDN